MYQTLAMSGLPRWLTPPKGVRDLIAGIAGAVVRGTTVSIPSVGTFNLSDPSQVAQLRAILGGTKLNVATPQPGPTGGGFDLNRTVTENVPGGWGTVVVGIGLVALLLSSRRRS